MLEPVGQGSMSYMSSSDITLWDTWSSPHTVPTRFSSIHTYKDLIHLYRIYQWVFICGGGVLLVLDSRNRQLTRFLEVVRLRFSPWTIAWSVMLTEVPVHSCTHFNQFQVWYNCIVRLGTVQLTWISSKGHYSLCAIRWPLDHPPHLCPVPSKQEK